MSHRFLIDVVSVLYQWRIYTLFVLLLKSSVMYHHGYATLFVIIGVSSVLCRQCIIHIVFVSYWCRQCTPTFCISHCLFYYCCRQCTVLLTYNLNCLFFYDVNVNWVIDVYATLLYYWCRRYTMSLMYINIVCFIIDIIIILYLGRVCHIY